MKKIKKFTLTSDVQLLSTNEQKEIVGGDFILEGCAHKTHEQCYGACILDGYEGVCGWSYGSFNRCTCAVVYIG